MSAIALGDHRRLKWPSDAEGAIVPSHATLRLMRVVRGHLVEDFGPVHKCKITVGASLRHIEHAAVGCIELDAVPAAVLRRSGPEVDDYVKDGACCASHQLGLGLRGRLVVHPAQYSANVV